MRKRIESIKFGPNHPMQGLTDTNLYDCVFSGAEYALKDAQNISMENCHFSLNTPLCNVRNFKMSDCRLEEGAQSALCGCEKGKILESDILGSQALSACRDIVIHDCSILSNEFGRDCEDIALEECTIHANSILAGSRNIRLDDVEIRGDAALQNVDGGQITDCVLYCANALQNSRNITIVDSFLKGDLLCWNCENITLIRCRIAGMQPLCHCRGLRLMDCTMEESELAFEYSDVRASITGHLHSVKNPLSGQITADTIGMIVMDDETLVSTAQITERA